MAWGAALPVQAACVLQRRAEVPVQVIEGFPVIPATIGVTPVSMLLDTGSQGHLILPGAADRLGLRRVPGLTIRMYGTGGARDVPNVMLQGVRIGQTPVPPVVTPVTDLPPVPETSPPLAGMLGAPLFAAYDMALDVPGGKLTLFEATECGAALPPPGPGLTTIPLEITPEGEAFLTVQVNGKDVRALLDTGSRATLITEGAARRLGLAGAASANTARGVDGQRLPVQHLRVREMRIGADLRRDAPVSIAPLQLGQGEMLLGLDYLGQRRIWVSFAAKRLVIAVP